MNLDIQLPSLMWPGEHPAIVPIQSSWEHDLGLSDLVNALSPSNRYTAYIRQTLAALVSDTQVIIWRQAVVADFVANPRLVEHASNLLPRLAGLGARNELLGKRQRNLLLETADHLAELEAYVQIVRELHTALHEAALTSQALLQVRDRLAELMSNPDFDRLSRELPELRAPLERIASLTIGINLDLELRPLSAVLLAINEQPLSGPHSWLERVIGSWNPNGDQPTPGLAPLHQSPELMEHRVLSPLFQDLDRLLTQTAQPVAKALARYARTGSGSLTHLEYELAFFASAARLIKRLENHGITCCQPEIAPPNDRMIIIEGLLNIALTIRDSAKPVPSDIEFGPTGRIAILTGPNSGGKTTFLRSVGLAQVMFQAGLFLPARKARLSPVDALLTHFPALESRQEGRLAEEAARLREVFQRATSRSLVLLNETFSSTSSGEALYLAQDILSGLRVIGARAIYATHLIELAECISDIEAAIEGDCHLFSLVAGIQMSENGDMLPTYQIMRGQPLGRSYAREIARRHGISLEQILEKRSS